MLRYINRRTLKTFLANKMRKMSTSTHQNFWLQVINTGGQGTSRSLTIQSEEARILINCGDTVKKGLLSSNAPFKSLQNILITKRVWHNLSNFLPLAISLKETGSGKVTLYSPKDCEVSLNREQEYLDDTGFDVDFTEVIHNKTIKIGPFSITPICLSKNPSDDSQGFGYIIKVPPKSGKMDIGKVRQLKIPPGPHLGDLQRGKPITLTDGRTIEPNEVLGPEHIYKPIVVYECDDPDHFPHAVDQLNLTEISPSLVVHLISRSVYTSRLFNDFIDDSPSSSHLVLTDDAATACGQKRRQFIDCLHQLDGRIFPRIDAMRSEQEFNSFQLRNSTCNVVVAVPLLIYQFLTDSFKYDSAHCEFEKNRFLTADPTLAEASLELYKAKRAEIANTDQSFPRITFLGTGSASSSSIRAVSSILLEVSADNFALLDCGPGTFGQLVDHYGIRRTDEILSRLHFIYISHLHADHSWGLPSVLLERKRAQLEENIGYEPLVVLGPRHLSLLLDTIDEKCEKLSYLKKHVWLETLDPSWKGPRTLNQTLKEMATNLGISIEVRRVPHTGTSFGISMTSTNGWKLTYSGDTLPSDNLIEIGRDSDILIHEATFDEFSAEEAAYKRHCTTREAVKAANKMRAKYTIFTHFSQRFTYLPPFLSDDETDETHRTLVGYAFDHMEISLAEMELFRYLWKPMMELFWEEYGKLLTYLEERKGNVIASLQWANKTEQRVVRSKRSPPQRLPPKTCANLDETEMSNKKKSRSSP